MINLQQLTTFCTVINEGSMTAAADRLCLTQPAVSQQIRNLEEDLQVELLEIKTFRQIKPTLAGQLLYDYGRKILYLCKEAEVNLKTIGMEVTGSLSVTTTNSVGLFMISPIIGVLLKNNSKLKVSVNYSEFDIILDNMKKGECDIAILPNIEKEFDVTMDNYFSYPIGNDEVWLVSSSKDSFNAKNISLSDINKKSIAYFNNIYPKFDKLLNEKLGEKDIALSTVFETSNVGTLKKVIENGLGWGFLPEHSISKQVNSGRMKKIKIDDFNYSVELCYYVKKDVVAQKAAEFLYRMIKYKLEKGV